MKNLKCKIQHAFSLLLMLMTGFMSPAQKSTPAGSFETDTFETSKGPLKITFIGHGTLMIEAGNQVIYIDPVSREADFSTFAKADLLLITHEHGDHLDNKAIARITKSETKIVISNSCKGLVNNALVFVNGDRKSFGDWEIEAVPAYNIVNKRSDGIVFHPKGNGNGYVISYGGKRIYIAGDTENIPEMAALKNINIAFLPMNLPYTMTPQMAGAAARSFMPEVLYPYHYGDTDPQLLVDLLKDTSIKVKIRKMK